MKPNRSSNDKPKLILLGAAVVVALLFIVFTLVGANGEAEVKEEDDDTFLILPTATVNSGVMLLWSVEDPLGRNPFDTDPRSNLGLGNVARPARPSQPTFPPLNPMGPGTQGLARISKTVILKGVLGVAGGSRLDATAVFEIEGRTSFYKIGDRLMKGVIITGMYVDGVVLDVNGEVEQLRVGQHYVPDIP